MIWSRKFELEELKPYLQNNMASHLGIEFIEIGDDYLIGKMPVDDRTRQPYGILHGGASVALAETLGSIASALCTDQSRYKTVGLEINANHIRAVREGEVYGTAKPIHLGRRTHVWEIKIKSGVGKLICISRLTTAIVEDI